MTELGFKLQWFRPSEGEWETLLHLRETKSLRAENKILKAILNELLYDLHENNAGATGYRVLKDDY